MNVHLLKLMQLSVLSTALGLHASPAVAQHQGHTMPAAEAAPAPGKKQSPVKKPLPAKKPASREAGRPAAAAHIASDHVSGQGTAAVEGMDHSKMQGMDHSKMEGMDHSKMQGMDHSKMEGMDHSKMQGMDHSKMQGMDHSKMQGMDHSKMEGMDHSKMEGMDHSKMQGMDHSKMDHAVDPDLPADAEPRTPIPPLESIDRAAAFPDTAGHSVHDQSIHSYWLADRLEWQDTEEGSLGWEGFAWIGGDLNRVWLRSEGEATGGEVEEGNVEILYGRSVSTWFDTVAGVRHDFGEGPSRTWAAIGVQGLAPYWFEVEATAYISDGGHTAATFEVEYETLITNRLILQWQGEAGFYGKDDPARGIGSGLSTVEAGARLRYEFTRRFAPYVGVEFERAFGETADLRRAGGDGVDDARLVAGIRFWF